MSDYLVHVGGTSNPTPEMQAQQISDLRAQLAAVTAERDTARAENCALRELLQDAGETLELVGGVIGAPVQSSHNNADNCFGGVAGMLADMRSALATPAPPCPHQQALAQLEAEKSKKNQGETIAKTNAAEADAAGGKGIRSGRETVHPEEASADACTPVEEKKESRLALFFGRPICKYCRKWETNCDCDGPFEPDIEYVIPCPHQQQAEQAYREASALFHALAPECEVLPDLLGVVMQIDSWSVAVTKQRDEFAAKLDAMRAISNKWCGRGESTEQLLSEIYQLLDCGEREVLAAHDAALLAPKDVEIARLQADVGKGDVQPHLRGVAGS